MPIARDREVFLQNLLATSATLLFRASQRLTDDDEALTIEIETWFRETKTQLIAALRAPEAPARIPAPDTSSSAEPAPNAGQYWKPPTTAQGKNLMSSYGPPVIDMVPDSRPVELLSPVSPFGNGSRKTDTPEKKPSPPSLGLSYFLS